MPRRDFDEDDDDDRPRRPSRRSRYEDEDDDYDDEPRRRRPSSNSNGLPLILGLVGGGFLLLVALAVGGIFAFRVGPVAPPPAPPQFAAVPQPAGPQPVFVPPGVPQGVIPDEVALECTISNLRVEGVGLGGRQALTFEYEFPGGRPFGGDRFIAVVTEPGKQASQVNLVGFMEAKNKVALNQFGGIANFARGTSVYIAKGFGNTKRVSNVLTLP